MFELVHAQDMNPKFLVRNLSPSLLTPRLRIKSLDHLSLSDMEKLGIENFILDVENTLCAHGSAYLDIRCRRVYDVVRNKYNACILSNAPEEMKREYEQAFDIPVVKTKARKPHPDAIGAALDLLGSTPSTTAMIGDRLFTDTAGANRMGVYSIKVDPLYPWSEPFAVMFARSFESCLLGIYGIFSPNIHNRQ